MPLSKLNIFSRIDAILGLFIGVFLKRCQKIRETLRCSVAPELCVLRQLGGTAAHISSRGGVIPNGGVNPGPAAGAGGAGGAGAGLG